MTVEIKQCDRDAAADVWRDYIDKTGEIIVERNMRKGGLDDGLPAIFARHRIAAEQRQSEPSGEDEGGAGAVRRYRRSLRRIAEGNLGKRTTRLLGRSPTTRCQNICVIRLINSKRRGMWGRSLNALQSILNAGTSPTSRPLSTSACAATASIAGVKGQPWGNISLMSFAPCQWGRNDHCNCFYCGQLRGCKEPGA